MPRRPRIVLPGTPLHIIQRGNNRQACFYSDSDYQVYLEWLQEYSNKYECQIHAYAIIGVREQLFLIFDASNI
jgi:putative transposase